MTLSKYFITLMLVLLLLSACTTLEIGVEYTPDSILPTPTSTIRLSRVGTAVHATQLAAPAYATAQAPASITPSPSPTPDPRVYVGVPKPNTLYWGQAGRRPALFVHNSGSLEDPNRGLLLYLDGSNSSFENSFDFQKLSRPYAVYTSEFRVDLADAKQDLAEKNVYVSLLLDQTPPCQPGGINDQPKPCPKIQEINRLIEVDLTTLASREIWTHKLFSDTYPGFEGNVVIDQVAEPLEAGGDRYLILR